MTESTKEEDLPAFVERCSLVHPSAREILIVATCSRLWKNSMGATGLVARITSAVLYQYTEREIALLEELLTK